MTGKSLSPWRQELLATLQLAWPMIVAQLAQMALFTTDVVMMGWLGPEHLAGGMLATAYLHPFMLLGIGILSAVSPLVAQAIGARDFRSIRRATRQGFWVALAVSVLLIPTLWPVRIWFDVLGQSPEMTLFAESYLHTALWVLVPSLLFNVLRGFLSSHSDTRVVLWITLIAIAVNAAGNYALMFGNWGFPRLELRGAAISTLFVNAVMLALTLAYVLRHRRYRRYHLLGRFWRPDWAAFRRILRIGTPSGLMLMAETGMFATAAMMMGWMGTAELAAHAIALQCVGIAFMVPLGLSMATTVRVGLAYGRRDHDAIGIAGWASLLLGTGFMSLTCLLFWLAPEILIGFFLDPALPKNQLPFSLAIGYLGVAALFQLVDGAQVVSTAALRGLNDTTVPMMVALLGYWGFGFPIAYACGFLLELGGKGIWYGLAAGLAFVAVILCARFALRRRFLLER